MFDDGWESAKGAYVSTIGSRVNVVNFDKAELAI